MKIRANAVNFGISILLVVWQLASVPRAHHWWAIGRHAAALVDPLFPTVVLSFSLISAARLRGRSIGSGALSVLGPIGVAVIYRWPLVPIPVAAVVPEPPPASPVILGAVTIAQLIIVVHTVSTYPWDKPLQWVGDLLLYLVVSFSMMPPLSRSLLDRGYPAAWAALGLLGPIGLIVVFTLPDRTVQPARGFAVEPPERL